MRKVHHEVGGEAKKRDFTSLPLPRRSCWSRLVILRQTTIEKSFGSFCLDSRCTIYPALRSSFERIEAARLDKPLQGGGGWRDLDLHVVGMCQESAQHLSELGCRLALPRAALLSTPRRSCAEGFQHRNLAGYLVGAGHALSFLKKIVYGQKDLSSRTDSARGGPGRCGSKAKTPQRPGRERAAGVLHPCPLYSTQADLSRRRSCCHCPPPAQVGQLSAEGASVDRSPGRSVTGRDIW